MSSGICGEICRSSLLRARLVVAVRAERKPSRVAVAKAGLRPSKVAAARVLPGPSRLAAARLRPLSLAAGRGGGRGGPAVDAGRYSAQLGLKKGDTITNVGPVQSFQVKPLPPQNYILYR